VKLSVEIMHVRLDRESVFIKDLAGSALDHPSLITSQIMADRVVFDRVVDAILWLSMVVGRKVPVALVCV
jgi:hypothetical protein